MSRGCAAIPETVGHRPPARVGCGVLKRALVLVLALAVAACALAPVAHADYKVGSSHPLLVKPHRLALPLPRMSSLPKVTVTPSGRLRVSATLRYRAANWKGRAKPARDRVTVTIAV